MPRLIGHLPGKLGPYAALWATLLVGCGLVVALAAGAAEVYEAVAAEDGIAGIDRPLLTAMLGLRTPESAGLATGFTNIGGSAVMPILAAVVVAALSWLSRSLRPLILVGAAAAGSLTMTYVGKALVGRARPDLADAVPPFESSPSFPSGHTLNTTAIVAVVAYLLCLQLTSIPGRVSVVVVCGTFIVAMGLSRVFLGHHWFTDVVAAWALGLAWAGVVVLAHQVFHTVWRVRRNRGSTTPEPG